MTQRLNADFNIDPLSTNGEELANILNRMIRAVDTTNAGNTRPAYNQKGMLWVDTSNATSVPSIFKLMLNNGTRDIPVAVFDMTNNTVSYTGIDLTKIMHTNSLQVMSAPISGITPTANAHLTRKDWVIAKINSLLNTALAVVMKTNVAQVMTKAISGIPPTADAHLTRLDYVRGEILAAKASGFNLAKAEILRANGGLETKTMELGGWNMQTTQDKVLLHGLNLNRIVSMKVSIYPDNLSLLEDFASLDWTGLSAGTKMIRAHATDITIRRPTGVFDTAAHSSTMNNRGWLVIRFKP